MSKLEQQIAQLINEHMQSCREEAFAAVERAFAEQMRTVPKPLAATRPEPPAGPKKSANKRRKKPQRRDPEEIRALEERIADALVANPGLTMEQLAGLLGEKSASLRRPVRRLKERGVIKSTGSRRHTRYFPKKSRRVA